MAYVAENETVLGYPRLAARMSANPEWLSFRSFAALNIQIGFVKQAELNHYERLLRSVESKEYHLGYSQDWYLTISEEDARTECSSSSKEQPSQMKLVRTIEKKLKEYNEHMIRISQILTSPKPRRVDIEAMQSLLSSKEMEPGCLTGLDCKTWGFLNQPHSHAPDLIAPCPSQREDPFSEWIGEKAIYKFKLHDWVEPSPITGRREISNNAVLRFTQFVVVIIASLLPMLSNVALFYLPSMEARFAVIAAFNVIGALSVIAITSVRRFEIFAILAAYSAIQVVFVANNKTPSN